MAFKTKKKTPNKQSQTSTPKTKKKWSRRQIVNSICITFLSTVLIVSIVGFVMLQNILSSSSLISGIDGLTADNSSRIFDRNGEVFKTYSSGDGVRENIKYEQIPQVAIDAFLSIEDSRFFKHNGFDMPRFIKSGFANVTAGNIVQGGSTLTMQLVDNALFPPEVTQNASTFKRIEQKIQEIFKSMEVDSKLSKEKILENYLNTINFGGSARGIQKGSEYYFGKNVEDLTLSEAAFLAGVINAPATNNPYNTNEIMGTTNITYYENAIQRRNETLQLMKYHGYIDNTEYELAKSAVLAFQLDGKKTFDTDPYQSYVDKVEKEIEELTGKNPNTTPMDIYTNMDREAQELADALCRGEGVEYPDERYQTGFSAINNQTGEILALGGGRAEATGDENTRINRSFGDIHQPGSTAKPYMDYINAFEFLGYSTEHVFEDGPVSYNNDGSTLWNAYRSFKGDVTFQEAVNESLNIPAYLMLKDVVNKIGEDKVVSLLNKMGADFDGTFGLPMAIGGGDLSLSPLQLAGIYQVFANKGDYIEPYAVSKITFQDSNESDYVAKQEKEKVYSEGSAFLVSHMLRGGVEFGFGNMKALQGSYPIYGKTGTSDYGDEAAELGYPEGVAKDKWIVGYTNEYTVSCWAGYDKGIAGVPNYLDEYRLTVNTEGTVVKAMLDNLTEGEASLIQQPSDVVSISHIQGLFPYATASNDGTLMVTGLINKKFAGNLKSVAPDPLSDPSSISVKFANDAVNVNMSAYPDASKLTVAEKTKTMTAGGETFSGRRIFDKSFLFGAVQYRADVFINGKKVGDSRVLNGNTATIPVDVEDGDKVKVCGFYQYANANVTSSQQCQEITIKKEPSEKTFTIGDTFTSIFTSTFEDSKKNVDTFMSQYPNVKYSVQKSTSVPAGQLDPTSDIYAGATVKTNTASPYIIRIGE